MYAISDGNERETVKDMVLADYQVPKGGKFVKIIQNLEAKFYTQMRIYLKHVKPCKIISTAVKVFACHNFSQLQSWYY
jgi:hypothetical protein